MLWISSSEIKSLKRVQMLDEAVFKLLYTNTLGKGMNTFAIPLAMDK